MKKNPDFYQHKLYFNDFRKNETLQKPENFTQDGITQKNSPLNRVVSIMNKNSTPVNFRTHIIIVSKCFLYAYLYHFNNLSKKKSSYSGFNLLKPLKMERVT